MWENFASGKGTVSRSFSRKVEFAFTKMDYFHEL